MNQKVNIEGKETFVNTFYTVTIDDYFAEALKEHISEGNIFQEEDFQYQGGNIPIILGSSYHQYYELGDVTGYNYLSDDLDFEVIGFFNAGKPS